MWEYPLSPWVDLIALWALYWPIWTASWPIKAQEEEEEEEEEEEKGAEEDKGDGKKVELNIAAIGNIEKNK